MEEKNIDRKFKKSFNFLFKIIFKKYLNVLEYFYLSEWAAAGSKINFGGGREKKRRI
uniref:Uncharacterized protein n=1 Tax=Meloidogyne enterolobii TaxID=390850 RepID=A0A6V7TN49_MELEN|nr:unnamed protein product [Meloidogyne enterolobii]